MGKHFTSLLGLVAIFTLVAVGASANDGVSLPYTCAIKKGLPHLTPSATQRFEIVGNRQKRVYRACHERGHADCRSMIVHSFRMRCGNVIVPWVQVAAAIRSEKVGDSWIKDGQLNLVIKDAKARAAGKKGLQFVLPLGYAPVAELGASLDPDPTSPILAPVKAANAEAAPKADKAVVEEPVYSTSTIPALLDDGSIYDPWEPTVHKVLVESSVGRGGPIITDATPASSSYAALLVVLAGSSLIAAASWFGRRHFVLSDHADPMLKDSSTGSSAQGKSEHLLGNLHSGALAGFGGLFAKIKSRWLSYKWNSFGAEKPWVWRNDNIANGAKSAEALYVRADEVVQSLGTASALRDTLTSELKVVRQRLDNLRGGPDDSPRTAKLAASLRSAVRDLQRIGRIAESAATSVKGGREEIVVPKSRAEAFEVLGLNPDSSEANLKRIVDALRMGWHPDHAKDDADKALREERTKQINIAWDLIVGKRAA